MAALTECDLLPRRLQHIIISEEEALMEEECIVCPGDLNVEKELIYTEDYSKKKSEHLSPWANVRRQTQL